MCVCRGGGVQNIWRALAGVVFVVAMVLKLPAFFLCAVLTHPVFHTNKHTTPHNTHTHTHTRTHTRRTHPWHHARTHAHTLTTSHTQPHAAHILIGAFAIHA